MDNIEAQRNDYVLTTPEEATYIPPKNKNVLNTLNKWQMNKFGILLHFGLYSEDGIVESWALCPEDEEWIGRYEYEDYFSFAQYYRDIRKKLNPVNFDPDKWAKAIKGSGARYMIYSTKHHDGFCLFDSKHTDFKITGKECPFSKNPKANITKEVLNSCRKEGLSVGAYYSKPDWTSPYFWWPYFPPKDRNPNYDIKKHPERWQKFIEYTRDQITEIVTEYGDLDILWFDGCWVRPLNTISKQVEEFCKYPYDLDIDMKSISEIARNKQPGILIVDRWVQGEFEDYLTPEQKIPEKALSVPWESCITMGTAWGWNPKDIYKTGRELIQLLIKIVAKGGNLLLGFGPDRTGEFDPVVYQRLEEMGSWLKINGEAIFDTNAIEPFQEENLAYTARGDNTLYAIYLTEKDEKQLPENVIIKTKFRSDISISLPAFKQNISFKIIENGLILNLPEKLRSELPSEPAIVIKITGRID